MLIDSQGLFTLVSRELIELFFPELGGHLLAHVGRHLGRHFGNLI